MRNVWSTASIIVLGLSVAGVHRAAAQGTGFEGTQTFQITNQNGKSVTMVVASKGSKLRVEVSDPTNPTHGGAFVVDGAAHTRMMVMDQQKKYIVIPESMAGAMGGMGKGANAANAPKFTFTKTGRTETVAGVSCQVIHGTGTNNGKTEEGDMCVAKGVGFNPATWASLGGQTGAGNSPWGAVGDEVGAGSGILKLTSTSNGQPGVTIEVTKIDRSPVSDDAFSPPAGYTQVQMPAGMGGGAPR
jgi:Domain of unknown function (DUF4412)